MAQTVSTICGARQGGRGTFICTLPSGHLATQPLHEMAWTISYVDAPAEDEQNDLTNEGPNPAGWGTRNQTPHCAVCFKSPAAVMTDGQEQVALCDDCRPMVVLFWHTGKTLVASVADTKQAKFGRQ